MVWGLLNPAALPFAAVAGATGWLAGWFIRAGAFRKIWRLVVSGLLLGLICGALAAPVAAFVYGGTAGVGTGAVVSCSVAGNSLLGSVTCRLLSIRLTSSLPVDRFRRGRALPKRTLSSSTVPEPVRNRLRSQLFMAAPDPVRPLTAGRGPELWILVRGSTPGISPWRDGRGLGGGGWQPTWSVPPRLRCWWRRRACHVLLLPPLFAGHGRPC